MEVIIVYSEYTKRINQLCVQNSEFFYDKAGGSYSKLCAYINR